VHNLKRGLKKHNVKGYTVLNNASDYRANGLPYLTLDLSPSSCCRSTSGSTLFIPSDPSLDPELHPMSHPTDPDLFSLLKSMTLLDVLSSF